MIHISSLKPFITQLYLPLENIHSQIDVFEQLIDEYEEVSVRNILERRKAKETKILDRYVEHLEYVFRLIYLHHYLHIILTQLINRKCFLLTGMNTII